MESKNLRDTAAVLTRCLYSPLKKFKHNPAAAAAPPGRNPSNIYSTFHLPSDGKFPETTPPPFTIKFPRAVRF